MHRESSGSPLDRSAAAQALVRDVLRRRTNGESLSDDQIISSHIDLMPEIELELRKLALVQRAFVTSSQSGTPPSQRLSRAADPSAVLLADSIAGYRIVGEIGHGGQAVVYEAIQQVTRRRVAIKVVRLRGTGAAAAARFEREAQILAGLRHPNIVAVHETGRVADACYCVMDFAPGVQLDEYFAARSRNPRSAQRSRDEARARVRLIQVIVEAIHTAHLHGVIHRDLKPANIRVDDQGQPIVLDFGLARIATGDLRDALQVETMTEAGQFVGSLPWASPEQASGASNTMDLRSDIYSLGVILYHSLTGRFPYDTSGGLPAVLHAIAHAHPTPMRAARAAEHIAAIDFDLETIVQKCLSKEPARRYQSARDLSIDLGSWLSGDAIDARRESRWYVFSKTIRRHKLAVGVAAAFVLVLAGSAVGLSLQAEQLRHERDAERVSRTTSQHVASFLGELVGAANPFTDPLNRRDLTLLDAVNRAAGRIEHELAGEPEVEASVRLILGRTYRELGEFDQAALHLQRSLALSQGLPQSRAADIAAAWHEIALLRAARTDYAGAMADCETALRLRTDAADNQGRAESLNLLANLLREQGQFRPAEDHARQALELRRAHFGDESAAVAESLNCLAGVLRAADRLADAEPLYKQSLELRKRVLGPTHPEVATTMNNLATLYCDQRRFQEAETPFREALEIYLANLSPDHPYIARATANLAAALLQQGQFNDAEPLFRRALEIRQKYSSGDADTATIRVHLAMIAERHARHEEAASGFEAALELRMRLLGPDHALTIQALQLAAQSHRRAGQLADAETRYRELLAKQRNQLPERDAALGDTLFQLALVRRARGDTGEAITFYREALAIRRSALGNAHPDVATTLNNLARLLEAGRDVEEAEPLYREAVQILQSATRASPAVVAGIQSNHGACLASLGRYDEALPVLTAAHQSLRTHRGPNHELTQRSLRRLIQALERAGEADQAAKKRTELVQLPSNADSASDD